MNLPAFARSILLTIFLSASGARSQPNPPPESLPAAGRNGVLVVKKNIPYTATATPRQTFDLYLPGVQTGLPVPLVLWIHGGAWMMGLKDWDNVSYLVRHGYAIASVDYRFSPEFRFPAQIQDCNTALNFILAHAREYGIDPKRFIVAGGSAGGHLALLLAMARKEKSFAPDPSLKPLAVLDFFGPADFSRLRSDLEDIHSTKGLELFRDATTKLFGVPLEQAATQANLASPVNYVSPAGPPMLLVHGEKDDLVPLAQSQRLHDALDRAGVSNQLVIVNGAGHDGPSFSTPDIESKVVAFLDAVQKPLDPIP